MQQEQPQLNNTQPEVILLTNASESKPVINKTKNSLVDFKRIIKFFILSVILFITLLVLSFIAYITNLDNKLIKVSFETQITTENNIPIPQAKIYLNDKEVGTTNQNGTLLVKDLEEGNYTLKVESTGYVTSQGSVNIKNSFFNYIVKKKYSLVSSEQAVLQGNLKVTDNSEYNFIDDRILINSKEYLLQNDGNFFLNGVPVGDVKFEYKSKNYKDIERTITIKPGSNNIESISLVGSGDIDGKLFSFIKEELVLDPNIQIEEVDPKNIIYGKDGEFLVKDLDIGKVYQLRITPLGYEQRDYSVTIKQGSNVIPTLKFVENGNAVYLTQPEDETNLQIFKSDFDGEDLQQLTFGTDRLTEYEPKNIFYDFSNEVIYFTSGIEKVRNENSRTAQLIYALKLSDLSINKITTNTALLGDIQPFYRANTLVNTIKTTRDTPQTILELMDLSGENRRTVKQIQNFNMNNILLNKDATYLVSINENILDKSKSLDLLNLGNLQSKSITAKENISLYDISDNGKRILFSAKDDKLSFDNLYLFDTETSEIRTLVVNKLGNEYQFLQGSDNSFVYWEEDSSKFNIYLFSIEQSTNNQIARLSSTDEITNLYQQSNFVFYTTKSSLYVIDPLKPFSYKLIGKGKKFGI